MQTVIANLVIVAGLLATVNPVTAVAGPLVFECSFPDSFSFVVTINKNGPWARIGREQGIGNKAKPYYDSVTGAWILVEFIADGELPSTLTTILRDGRTWHSRHTMDILGRILPSQMAGKCSEVQQQ